MPSHKRSFESSGAKKFVLILSLCLLLSSARSMDNTSSTPTASQTAHSDLLISAARQFLASLDKGQHARASLPFDDPRRMDWNYMPVKYRDGLPLSDMTAAQREKALSLLRACLSPVGYDKAILVMKQEDVIGYLEKSRGPLRDPLQYCFCVFGEPSGSGRWAIAIEGHHLSVNLVLADRQVICATPLFFGANPATVLDNGGTTIATGTRLLQAEEELGVRMIHSLDTAARAKAIIAQQTALDMDEVRKAQTGLPAGQGIAGSDLTADQFEILQSIVRIVASNGPPSVVDSSLKQFRTETKDVFFSWSGSTGEGEPHSWGIYSPSILILMYKAQSDPAGNKANHTHLLWRTPGRDFGVASGQ